MIIIRLNLGFKKGEDDLGKHGPHRGTRHPHHRGTRHPHHGTRKPREVELMESDLLIKIF